MVILTFIFVCVLHRVLGFISFCQLKTNVFFLFLLVPINTLIYQSIKQYTDMRFSHNTKKRKKKTERNNTKTQHTIHNGNSSKKYYLIRLISI